MLLRCTSVQLARSYGWRVSAFTPLSEGKIVPDRNAFRAKEGGLPMVNSELTPSVSHDPKDLEGTWTLVSVVTERDGKRFDAYGPDAKAIWCSIRSGDIQSSSFRVASRSLRRIAAPARRQMRASLLFLEASLISALTSSTRRTRVSRFKSSVRHFPTGMARTRNVRLVSG